MTKQLIQPLKAIITGANSGIGFAQCKLFLEKGHKVVAIDKNQSEELKKLKRTYDEDCYLIQFDLAQSESIPQIIEEALTFLGSINVVCNTAGILDDYATIEELSLEDWEYYFRVNVTSMFAVAKATLPHLLKQPSARMINMSSIASLTAGGGGIAYTANKHAVAGLTKQLAFDYGDSGLRVNAIAPGAIDTAMNANDFTQNKGEMAKWVAQETPIKRWGTAEEVAQLTLYLASDASDYIHGAIIPVDGGWMIR